MTNTKFIVKVDRGGTHAAQYVQRIDRSPVQMTVNRKLALVMGKFTAEDAANQFKTPGAFLSCCPCPMSHSRAEALRLREESGPFIRQSLGVHSVD